jgi:hypothetical protein
LAKRFEIYLIRIIWSEKTDGNNLLTEAGNNYGCCEEVETSKKVKSKEKETKNLIDFGR